jgi:hypothetical protein
MNIYLFTLLSDMDTKYSPTKMIYFKINDVDYCLPKYITDKIGIFKEFIDWNFDDPINFVIENTLVANSVELVFDILTKVNEPSFYRMEYIQILGIICCMKYFLVDDIYVTYVKKYFKEGLMDEETCGISLMRFNNFMKDFESISHIPETNILIDLICKKSPLWNHVDVNCILNSSFPNDIKRKLISRCCGEIIGSQYHICFVANNNKIWEKRNYALSHFEEDITVIDFIDDFDRLKQIFNSHFGDRKLLKFSSVKIIYHRDLVELVIGGDIYYAVIEKNTHKKSDKKYKRDIIAKYEHYIDGTCWTLNISNIIADVFAEELMS